MCVVINTHAQVAARISDGPAVVNVLTRSTVITGLFTGLTYEFKV